MHGVGRVKIAKVAIPLRLNKLLHEQKTFDSEGPGPSFNETFPQNFTSF